MQLASIIERLKEPAAYPHAVDRVEVVHTHASVVFLAGEYAYKIKKPVDLGFLDYSTLPRRKQMCEAEVRLNQRLAPRVYLGVVPIGGDRLDVGGTEPVHEYAVKMRRLPDRARLGPRLAAGEVGPAEIDTLARRLARFHRAAARGEAIAAMASHTVVSGNAEENLVQLQPVIGTALSDPVYRRLSALTRAELQRQRPLIEQRAAAGLACETHGDLRLEHIYLFPDRPPPDDLAIVDCIEFNERFRYADPVADLAFLVMDLQAHGFASVARRLADAYFEASGDTDGRALLPLYTAYRATVRGKVRAIQAAEPEVPSATREAAQQVARGHLLQALVELAPPTERPCALLMCGLPGTGKSVLAAGLAEQAGFTVVRADAMRKRLAGLDPLHRTGDAPLAGLYGPEWTERTYTACREEAERILFAGGRVIVDATFRDEALRRTFLEAFSAWNVPARILHLELHRDEARRRLDARHGDVSEATFAVYEEMERIWEPFGPASADVVTKVDAGGSPADTLARGLEALGGVGLAGPDKTRRVA